jgi:hypothetical protein
MHVPMRYYTNECHARRAACIPTLIASNNTIQNIVGVMIVDSNHHHMITITTTTANEKIIITIIIIGLNITTSRRFQVTTRMMIMVPNAIMTFLPWYWRVR